MEMETRNIPGHLILFYVVLKVTCKGITITNQSINPEALRKSTRGLKKLDYRESVRPEHTPSMGAGGKG